ncbi:TetR/AcrR family transcriptional regulator [Thalassobacillus pellis]|uniref:TetR/AcrR family transcriptional regulator n=1 Tax=Thalassobacillus pellis TaxID=748008 RepID=UPI001961BD22|nr:TetR/AcrR family transcriptional regulator [Thalassobacillus pellis]MBM7552542.1 AcrR family transcriptional regulator [Thalassobacillus pellis]
MGRKKALSNDELFQATEELLVENGIHAFHFKDLAEMLNVSRSTIYEYYTNKHELILSYMKDLMVKINDRIDEIEDNQPPEKKLHQLLHIFLEFTQIHHINEIIAQVRCQEESSIINYRKELFQQHQYAYKKMTAWIEEAKDQERWRTDIHTVVIADLIFHSILFRQKGIGEQLLADQLFSLIHNGMGKDTK